MTIRHIPARAFGLIAVALLPVMAQADTMLPAPYVSRALDAVLMPVDDAVRGTFGLAATDSGLLVIALDPEGTAAALGLQPGSVIGTVGDTPLTAPIELDEIVLYWITQGTPEIQFGVWQQGTLAALSASITQADYASEIVLTSVATWSAWEVSSFSYESYYSEYSEEITASYAESETVIEEAVSSESFEAEMSAETDATVEEEAMADEGAADCTVDDSCGDAGAEDAGDGGDEGGDGAVEE